MDTLPWVEKYRPTNINEIISHQQNIITIKKLLLGDSLPHLLFYGPPGTGKTTMIVQLVTNLVKNSFVKRIAIVAPTNKALSVIKTKFNPQLRIIIDKLNLTTNESSFDLILEYLKTKKHYRQNGMDEDFFFNKRFIKLIN